MYVTITGKLTVTDATVTSVMRFPDQKFEMEKASDELPSCVSYIISDLSFEQRKAFLM
jgi:hypothetical protein